MKAWYKELVGYEIYPRSFKDSNGDGIGDINGIIEKLDYLKDLGIGLIWVCPMYDSPNDDNGYDIKDYKKILKDFGTMEDFDNLLKEVHKRDMKIILDLVVNHTSDEHPWFIESKNKNSKKKDWYIWRPSKDGEEPNNWESIFKGSAWQYDKDREEYYMHLFSKKQPDLNWENEEVREAIYEMINWWLLKGIDGFRVDAISHIKKEQGLKDMDNPNNLKYVESFEKHMNVEGIQEYLKELKEKTFDKHNIVTVGEANGVNSKDAKEWVGEKEGKFNMVFQFEHLKLWDYEKGTPFNIKRYKDILTKWQLDLEGVGWNALYIENHDIPRCVSTWGDDKEYREKSAKAFAASYFLQTGTPFIYQGQELGMTNVKYSSIEDYNDIKGINIYNEKIEEGMKKEEALQYVYAISRDNARTPMQWNKKENGGFTTGTPWLPTNPNYKTINVETELLDENSILNFYKKLIKIRNNSETLIYGKYRPLLKEDENIFAYERIGSNETYTVIANLSSNTCKLPLKDLGEMILTNYDNNSLEICKPFETRVYLKSNKF